MIRLRLAPWLRLYSFQVLSAHAAALPRLCDLRPFDMECFQLLLDDSLVLLDSGLRARGSQLLRKLPNPLRLADLCAEPLCGVTRGQRSPRL